jgi:tetratricopeptide (TPR) repeat protein/DNA-binding winged helix-turn-helix (wHTH) protein
MHLAAKLYRLGDVEIDLSRACVKRNGREQYLRPQAFEVLLHLLENRNRVVTKEELIEAVWADTAVTDNALVQCVAEIRRALKDDPHHPRFIRTFSKAGYRFIGPVEERPLAVEPTPTDELATQKDVAVDPPAQQAIRDDKPGPARTASREKTAVADAAVDMPSVSVISEAPITAPANPVSISQIAGNDVGNRVIRRAWWRRGYVRVIAASLIGVAIALGILAGVRSTTEFSHAATVLPKVPGKHAVAVMYFDDHSDRQDLDWLREGLADMLITDLARSEKLTVLSRQQLFLLLKRIGHNSSDEIRLDEALDIGHRTNADAVLLGSFSAFGEQIRIDAQLYDTNTGQLIAADQLVVSNPGEILTRIDGLALKLEGRLGTSVDDATQMSVANSMTDNIEAYRYYSLGVEKALAFQNAEAIELLHKAIELDPKFAMAYARIGYAYAVTDFLPYKGRPYLEKALQLSGPLSEKDKLSIRAWYEISKSDFPEAIRLFQQIIAQYPRDTEAYGRLALLLIGEERGEEAIAVLNQALTIDPEGKELYNVLGVTYLRLGHYNEAIAAHQHYVALAPKEPNAHDSYGMSLQESGHYDEAIQEYNTALNLDPEFEPAIVHLGDTYFQQGRYHDAIRQYQRYIDVTHSDSAKSVGYGSIGWVYLQEGDLKDARQAAANEMRYGKGAPWISLLVALKQGDRTKAEKLKDMLMQSSSFTERGARDDTRRVKFFIAYTELKTGDSAKAIRDFQDALRHLPPSSGIDLYNDCLANAYLQTGHFDEAIQEYNRILSRNPNYPLAMYHLAQAYEAKGDKENARNSMRKFLETWPRADSDLPEIKQAKEMLM